MLRGSTDEPAWYAAQLANVPARFTLIGSDAVRAEVSALAERLHAAVTGTGGPPPLDALAGTLP